MSEKTLRELIDGVNAECDEAETLKHWRLVYIGQLITPYLAIWAPGYRVWDAEVICQYVLTPEEAQLTKAELEAKYPLVRPEKKNVETPTGH